MDLKYIDLFSGIGGFRIAANQVADELGIRITCVLSSDIDPYCREEYAANFGEIPYGDIEKLPSSEIPNHDILFAGFPCQPFSIIGSRKGFNDTRGTLFFEIARILKDKKPRAFILENVKQLVGHQKGYTLKRILESLDDLGYYVEYKVLNALHYGLPQKRERVFIVGTLEQIDFKWPSRTLSFRSLEEILEKEVPQKYYASEKIRQKRRERHISSHSPAIWHENKSGNVSSYPYSCALRAGASYNYLLVDGERRLTPREMLRLQGFPDHYKIVVPDAQIRKQAGNSVPVNVVIAVLKSLIQALSSKQRTTRSEKGKYGRQINAPFANG